MMHEYRPYPQTYRPSLRARWCARFSDTWTQIHGHFWNWWFEEIDWRAVDRFVTRCTTYFLIAAGIYVAGLVLYTVGIILAVTYGVWPKW